MNRQFRLNDLWKSKRGNVCFVDRVKEVEHLEETGPLIVARLRHVSKKRLEYREINRTHNWIFIEGDGE